MKNNFSSPIDFRTPEEKEHPIVNPNLEGDNFFWKGGKIGVLSIRYIYDNMYVMCVYMYI